MEKHKKLMIRNSTAEFLIFTKQTGGDSINVLVADENVWLTQDMMAMLFDKKRNTIAEHLQTLYADKELDESQVCRKFRQTSESGNYTYKFYNLEAVIAVGFKVNSERAVQFRQWAAKVLKDFAISGYVLDKKRLENGVFLNDEYFKHLLEEIREIRLSERMFYQKITDIYATAIDYDSNNYKTTLFYKTVQNKLHYAIHRHTAAELIVRRADAEKEHMGLATWEKAPHGKIIKNDVSIAKNYLSKEEMRSLSRTVGMYLDYAEQQAERRIPMTMNDWTKRLDSFLEFNEYGILQDAGSVSAEEAKQRAESEFEKYRIIQDKLFKSDFDKYMEIDLSELEKAALARLNNDDDIK